MVISKPCSWTLDFCPSPAPPNAVLHNQHYNALRRSSPPLPYIPFAAIQLNIPQNVKIHQRSRSMYSPSLSYALLGCVCVVSDPDPAARRPLPLLPPLRKPPAQLLTSLQPSRAQDTTPPSSPSSESSSTSSISCMRPRRSAVLPRSRSRSSSSASPPPRRRPRRYTSSMKGSSTSCERTLSGRAAEGESLRAEAMADWDGRDEVAVS